jgi:subtilase family serine protease
MAHLVRLRIAGAAVAAAALTIGGLSTATAAQAAQRRAIAGTHPAWAVAANRLGTQAATSGSISARIYLAGRDQAGLTRYASAVSAPGSGSYGHYLTAAQLLARYGATRAQVAAIESWVRSAGLRVTSANREIGGYVAVTGSLAAASRAFGTGFATFRGPDGHSYRAPDQPASAPAGVAADILAITGLSTQPELMRPYLPPPGPNYWIAKPCSKYYGQKIAHNKPTAYGRHQPWTNCGYTPQQIRGAYGVTSSGMTGRGQTVAIVDAYDSPTMPGDANKFARVTGVQPFRRGQYAQHLRTLAINGEGRAALRATRGYDDATGVGSPRDYIQSFER